MRPLLRATLFLALLMARPGLMAQTQGTYAGPFVISGILVEGNKSTMERVIVREMLLAYLPDHHRHEMAEAA